MSLTVAVWRGAAAGRLVEYQVPTQQNQTVLDVATYIQRHLDPTLSYRFACRVGMCGSCAMSVNGVPRWTCRTHVQRVARAGRIELRPLDHLPVIKDLAVDMTEFFDKWARAKGAFVPPARRPEDFVAVPPADPARQAASAGIECIGCGVCYAACDLVERSPDFLGPAALNRVWTLVKDVRDAGSAARLEAISGAAGCHACHSEQSCVERCPKAIDPTAGIAGLKRATAAAAWRALFQR